MASWHPVAVESDLIDDQALAVRLGQLALLLVRHQGALYAIADRCSHADQELVCGIVRNGWISCPAHGARFDLASGEPLTLPATTAIATFQARIREGQVEVCLPS